MDLMTLPKSRGQELQIGVREYKGRSYLDFRVYYSADNGEMRPTSKGCTAPIDAIPDIIKALQCGEADLRAAGILTGEVVDLYPDNAG